MKRFEATLVLQGPNQAIGRSVAAQSCACSTGRDLQSPALFPLSNIPAGSRGPQSGSVALRFVNNSLDDKQFSNAQNGKITRSEVRDKVRDERKSK